jgi:hypothetical protein
VLAQPDEEPATRELGDGAHAAVAALPGVGFTVVAERRAGGRSRLVAWDL